MLASLSKNEVLLIMSVAVVLIYVSYKLVMVFLRNRRLRPSRSLDVQPRFPDLRLTGPTSDSEGEVKTEITAIKDTERVLTSNLEKYQKLLG